MERRLDMKGTFFTKALAVLTAIFFVGCAAPQFKPAPFTPHRFDMDQYVPKVDNVIILFDASSSMTGEDYKGTPKINIAKDFVYRMNQTMPDLKIKAGMRAFGQNPSVGPGDTALVYGMTDYSQAGLNRAINSIQKKGLITPIGAALKSAGSDLETAQGPIAVILVSDGQNPDIPDLPYLGEDASALKNEYGDRLCFYTIGIGDDRQGLNRLRKIADIGSCGSYTNAEDLESASAMADFVEKVFLSKRPMPAMMPAPKPVAPKPAMAPMDSDGDGVYDDRDKCPNTPKGAEVDADGCWKIGMIHFDFDKSNIKPQYEPILNKIADVMKENPMVHLRIDGHTDSIGTEVYNQGLSERRARSAEQYLIGKGIDAGRISIFGHSFLQPIATNETSAGRAQNRRDEFSQIP